LASNKLTCIVCGRRFPRGQGVVLVVKGKEYLFHSKACALKFLRRVFEEIDEELLYSAFEKTLKKFSEELKRAELMRKKKI